MTFTYDWQASLAALLLTIVIAALGRRLAFMVPAFKQTLAENREANRPKFKNERFKPIILKNQKMGLIYNLVFFVILMPFFTIFEQHDPIHRALSRRCHQGAV